MTWPYPVRLDRRVHLTGVHSAGTTTWTLPYTDPNINAIVLGPDFGSSAGTVVTPATNSGTTLTATGNYSAGECAIGVKYTASVTLSRPYLRDQAGRALANAWLTIRKVTAFFYRTGYFKIVASQTGRSDRIKSYTATGSTRASGELEAWHGGNTQDTSHSIQSDSARPFTVNGIQYDLDATMGT